MYSILSKFFLYSWLLCVSPFIYLKKNILYSFILFISRLMGISDSCTWQYYHQLSYFLPFSRMYQNSLHHCLTVILSSGSVAAPVNMARQFRYQLENENANEVVPGILGERESSKILCWGKQSRALHLHFLIPRPCHLVVKEHSRSNRRTVKSDRQTARHTDGLIDSLNKKWNTKRTR